VPASSSLPIAFAWALVFGALISPTDPIAVLAVLKQARVVAPTWRRVSLFAAAGLLAASLFVQPMAVVPHFLLPVQVMARFRQVDAREGEYFQRSWLRINRDLFAYRSGAPFAPLERARERLPVGKTTWLAKEIRQLVVPNLYWADQSRQPR
jgi:hypothetical protein